MRYIHVPAEGTASGSLPAVVFVHGLMGYSFSWRHNLKFFAQQRDVYAMDLLGIGHSDRPEANSVDFGLAATATRLLTFLRSLGHSQIDLVATSHGGAVAMMAASQDLSSPEPLIRRLVLVAPAHPFMTDARFRLAFFRTPFGRMVMRSVASHSHALRDKAIGRMYADDSRITPETRAGYEANLGDPRSYEYALEVVRTWRQDMQQLQAVLPLIASVPMLLLWGKEDRVVSCDSGLRLRRCFRNAEYVVLPDAGHLPYEETPEKFNRCVLQFVEGKRTSASAASDDDSRGRCHNNYHVSL